MGRKPQTLEKLLDNTTPDGDCLHWNGCKDRDGYGITSSKGIKMPAHRAVMSFIHDVTDHYVLHKCTNRDCINPNHLYLGDQKQNVQDQIDAGTFVCGSKNGMSVLTDGEVLEIRSSNLPMKRLAILYKISYYTIWDIKRNRTWKHLL
jgi:hypothetical protein